jgi:cyclic pyranopterin phosphate synthase
MTAGEIQRIVGIGVERLGVRELRLTGGEPLVRPDLVGIIVGTAGMGARPEHRAPLY